LATPTLGNNISNAVAHLFTTLQLGQALQDSHSISATQSQNHGNSNNHGGRGGRGGSGGRGHGKGRNIYLGSLSPEQWRKLSPLDKKKVYDGRQKSTEAQPQGGNTTYTQGTRHIAATTTDGQSTIVASVASNTQQMKQAILQGTLQGSAAIGEKRNNTESASSQMSRQRMNAVSSSVHTVTSQDRTVFMVVYRKYQNHHETVSRQCELDSHAETCVMGANCVVLEETGQKVSISASTDAHRTFTNIPIVTAATAYDDTVTGTTYIFILKPPASNQNYPFQQNDHGLRN
jgi:hypothetical protein